MLVGEVGPQDGPLLQQVANMLFSSKKCVLITGAGISTNLGLPVRVQISGGPPQTSSPHSEEMLTHGAIQQDFRSEGGLYSLIQTEYKAVARSNKPTTRKSDQTILGALPPSSNGTFTARQRSRSPIQSIATPSPSSIKGKDHFDVRIWADPVQTAISYKFIASLRRKIREAIKQTAETHKLIRALRDGGRLVRCYTQNIDGLEAREGLCTDMRRGRGNRNRFLKRVVGLARAEKEGLPGGESDRGCEVVQLHGNLTKLRCQVCDETFEWNDERWETLLLAGSAPVCKVCDAKDEDCRKRGKRSITVGMLRPNVVLYGESHPAATLLGEITEHDIELAPDVLLIIGTSLRVDDLKRLVKEFSRAVHAQGTENGKVLFVNNTKPPDSVWKGVIDIRVRMDCDLWVQDLRLQREDLWECQNTSCLPLEGHSESSESTLASHHRLAGFSPADGIPSVLRGMGHGNPSVMHPAIAGLLPHVMNPAEQHDNLLSNDLRNIIPSRPSAHVPCTATPPGRESIEDLQGPSKRKRLDKSLSMESDSGGIECQSQPESEVPDDLHRNQAEDDERARLELEAWEAKPESSWKVFSVARREVFLLRRKISKTV